METFSLFPVAVCSNNLNRTFTKQELKFVKKTETECMPNAGNTTSKNTYILEEKVFKNLKIEIQKYINEYIEKIICPDKKIEYYITQSWLNYTKPNQYHQQHNHANSILSGVLYFNADEKFDMIKFSKNINYQMMISTKNFNVYNAETWFIRIKTGQLVIFPSYLQHLVPIKEGTNLRISLSFNTFVRGTLGNTNQLTELKLNV